MPLFRVAYETTYVKRDPDGYGSVGATYARKHDIIIEAANVKVAAEDGLRFMRNRQDGEEKMAKLMDDTPTYESYWGELAAMNVRPWSPKVVREDGNLGEAPGFCIYGFFEWKCDFPSTVEQEIGFIKLETGE